MNLSFYRFPSCNAAARHWTGVVLLAGVVLLTGCSQWDLDKIDAATPLLRTTSHKATDANVANSTTMSQISDPILDGNPNAFVFATANWQGGNVYNPSPVGVQYQNNHWYLVNLDKTLRFPVGVNYNLLVVKPGSNVFRHVATASNIESNLTRLDHPLLNNNPNARLLVQQRGGNNSPVGVYYYAAKQCWSIFNQKGVPIAIGSEYNVFVSTDLQVSTTTTSAQNLPIQPPISNANAKLFLTQCYNGTANPSEVGVWFPSSWYFYNQTTSLKIPLNARFFVLTQ